MSERKKISIVHRFGKKQETKYRSPFKLTFCCVRPENQSNNDYYTDAVVLSHALVDLFFSNLQSENKNTKF